MRRTTTRSPSGRNFMQTSPKTLDLLTNIRDGSTHRARVPKPCGVFRSPQAKGQRSPHAFPSPGNRSWRFQGFRDEGRTSPPFERYSDEVQPPAPNIAVNEGSRNKGDSHEEGYESCFG